MNNCQSNTQHCQTGCENISGCLQLGGGQISGIEATVHAVLTAFESDENEAVFLVDASNAFNFLNRQVALHNIRRLCPLLATILINTYRAPTELIVDGDTILSQEGTTQGDPLAIPMYALATIPLIKKLHRNYKQVWYVDDAAAVGGLWTCAIGGIGYLPLARALVIFQMLIFQITGWRPSSQSRDEN